MDPIDPKRVREFLDKLVGLCVEYGVEIQGCGCCGSPALELGAGYVSQIGVKKSAPMANGEELAPGELPRITYYPGSTPAVPRG